MMNHVPTENRRYYEAEAGVAVKNMQLRLADAVSEEYVLYKIEDTPIPQDSYLFVFSTCFNGKS